MIAVTVRDGRLVVEIPSPTGEVFLYHCEPREPDPVKNQVFACVVSHVEAEEAAYKVALLRNGWWWCECNDWKYRSRKKPEGCKHCIAGAEIRALMGAFGKEQQHERGATERSRPAV